MTAQEAERFLLSEAEPDDATLALRVFRERQDAGDTALAAAIAACRAVLARLEGPGDA